MEAAAQPEQTSQQVEVTQPESEAPDQAPAAPKSDSFANFIVAALDKIDKEGCNCSRPECGARSMHKLNTALPEEFKPHWQIVKEGMEKQFAAAIKEAKKMQKQCEQLDNDIRRESRDKQLLQSQLSEAQRANLKLVKTVARLSKK